jgi:streptomycin 6-kinase
VEVPSSLEWWRERPEGAAWLEQLPGIVAECAEQWALKLGSAFPGSNVSYAAPAALPDGREAVLKVNIPDAESEHEADALALWRGEGAVELLAHDPRRSALLVERCQPGTSLWSVPDEEEANRIAARVLRRIWRTPPPEHPFRPLAAEALRWAEALPRAWRALGEPFERTLVERAAAEARELAESQGELVVVHQDFHGDNVLRAERQSWLAIDPKPLVGEREFDGASLLRDRRRELIRDPAAGRRVRRRLDQLSSELELDRERMRGWGIVHALAWGVSGTGVEDDMVACARWLAERCAR